MLDARASTCASEGGRFCRMRGGCASILVDFAHPCASDAHPTRIERASAEHPSAPEHNWGSFRREWSFNEIQKVQLTKNTAENGYQSPLAARPLISGKSRPFWSVFGRIHAHRTRIGRASEGYPRTHPRGLRRRIRRGLVCASSTGP